MGSRKALLIAAAATMAVVMGALLPPATARPGNYVVGEQKFWSGGEHIHEVGDNDGWTLGPNYDNWATANDDIPAGDQLHFRYEYDRTSHNVVQLEDEDSYTNCIVPNNAATWNSGDDFLTLSNAGTYYFVCGNHCASGMKFAISTYE